uniref:GLOBIN domain-containing protein n=1 Tax=Steinernema glaseri TaxID=37863 RepID=A0A1I8A5T4_9BILA
MGNTRSASSSRCPAGQSDALLNPYQKATVRSVFSHMSMSKTGHGNCGRTAMKRLLYKDSDVRHVFQNTDAFGGMIVAVSTGRRTGRCGIDEHAHEIVKLLQMVLQNLDSPQRIAEECERIGRMHRRLKMFGMKTEHWDLFGEAISETVREYQGWRKHREALRSANILVSMIVDRLRKGFQQKEGDTRRSRYTPPKRSVSEVGSRDSELLESSVASVASERSSTSVALEADRNANSGEKKKCVNRSKSLNIRRVLPKTPDELDANGNLLLPLLLLDTHPIRKCSGPPRLLHQSKK